jgi:hypothetical protein
MQQSEQDMKEERTDDKAIGRSVDDFAIAHLAGEFDFVVGRSAAKLRNVFYVLFLPFSFGPFASPRRCTNSGGIACVCLCFSNVSESNHINSVSLM